MAFPYMLMATQAAGMATSLFARNKAKKYDEIGMQYSRMGAQIEANEIGMRMEQETMQAAEESLMSSENLREVLASQRAILAGRGTKIGVGSAVGVQEKSVRAYNADERARKLSLDFRKRTYENQMKLTQIGLQAKGMGVRAKGQKRDFGLLLQGLNQIDTNTLFGPQKGFTEFFGMRK